MYVVREILFIYLKCYVFIVRYYIYVSCCYMFIVKYCLCI